MGVVMRIECIQCIDTVSGKMLLLLLVFPYNNNNNKCGSAVNVDVATTSLLPLCKGHLRLKKLVDCYNENEVKIRVAEFSLIPQWLPHAFHRILSVYGVPSLWPSLLLLLLLVLLLLLLLLDSSVISHSINETCV